MYKLREVERISGIDREAFLQEYVKPGRPVIIEDYSKGWPALNKWNFEFFKTKVGKREIPLYDDSKADYAKKVNEPAARMLFPDYIDLIQREPSNLRIFLFNIFKEVPELCEDFFAPSISPDVLVRFPMMFFGGKGSKVFLHYDIDMSDVFHTHFGGNKKAILFDHDYKDLLYRLPFSVHNIEDINIENPDIQQWPAMAKVKGYEASLHNGDTLYMPSGLWHFMNYIDSGFSLSLRALSHSWVSRAKGLYNISVMRQVDNAGRKIGGPRWMDYKERQAINRANSILAAH